MEDAGPVCGTHPVLERKEKNRYCFFCILHKLSHTKRSTNAKQNCCFSHWTYEMIIFFMFSMLKCHYRATFTVLPTWLTENRQVTVTIMYQFICRESLYFLILILNVIWHTFWPFHYVVYFYFTASLIPEPFSWSLQQLSQSGFEWVPLHQDDPRDCILQFHPPHSNDKQKVKGNVNNTSLKLTIIYNS